MKGQKQILFENLILTSRQFCENTILAQSATSCVFEHTQKHDKNRGKQWNTNLDQFWALNMEQLLTLNPPNLGPVFNFTATNPPPPTCQSITMLEIVLALQLA